MYDQPHAYLARAVEHMEKAREWRDVARRAKGGDRAYAWSEARSLIRCARKACRWGMNAERYFSTPEML